MIRTLPSLARCGSVRVIYDSAMASANLSIGVVSKRTGCSVPTIRYYEDIGLLPSAHRTDGGQRSFSEATVGRLTFIRRCRDFGFSLEQIRELVGLVDEPTRPCIEVRNLAATHLDEVQRKLMELQALERSLQGFVRACDKACAGGAALDCTILEDLSRPVERSPNQGNGCCGGQEKPTI